MNSEQINTTAFVDSYSHDHVHNKNASHKTPAQQPLTTPYSSRQRLKEKPPYTPSCDTINAQDIAGHVAEMNATELTDRRRG